MKCTTCSHRQNYDGNNRCARYHESICNKAYKHCQGKHYMNTQNGISLHAMKHWINNLTPQELTHPLLFQTNNNKLLPTIITKTHDQHGTHWCFHAKNKNTNNKCQHLTSNHTIEYRTNSKGKKTPLPTTEHRCTKTNKTINPQHDCTNCNNYLNTTELNTQIKNLEYELEAQKQDLTFLKTRLEEVLTEYNIDTATFFKKIYYEQ